MNLIAQTTYPTLPQAPLSWRDPAMVGYIVIVAAVAYAIYRSIRSDAKADVAKSLAETNATHVQSVDRQLTTIALHAPAPQSAPAHFVTGMRIGEVQPLQGKVSPPSATFPPDVRKDTP